MAKNVVLGPMNMLIQLQRYSTQVPGLSCKLVDYIGEPCRAINGRFQTRIELLLSD